MNTTQDIVQKLWSLCHVLRDDGITYHEYVTELTYLLFLKMAKETEREAELPEGYRWDDLDAKDGVEQLNFYRQLLLHLGKLVVRHRRDDRLRQQLGVLVLHQRLYPIAVDLGGRRVVLFVLVQHHRHARVLIGRGLCRIAGRHHKAA